MIPGPVNVEDEVLDAFAQPVLPHYGPQWLEIYHETIDLLKQVFGTQNDLLLMSGPGSLGLDAALGSLMRTGDKVLVASNGFFGNRFRAIAQSYGLEVVLVAAPQGRPVDPNAIREQLAAQPDIQAVAVVHLETSCGVLNPVQEIAAIANEFGVTVIVDAVSSMGGLPLPVDEWGIDVCISVANKCLACPPGLALVAVSPRAWEQIERKGGRAHGWYLNLRVWKDYSINWGSWHPTPTTMPSNLVVALHTSLHRILDEGLEAYYARFARAAQLVRARLKQLGFEMFTAEAHTSPVITAVRGLPGMDIADFRRYLLEEWQVMISGGLDELRGQIFRVGHMGKASSTECSKRFLEGVEAYLGLKGYNLPPQEAVG
jgi:alanine-glyoxylate transaminase/serine-glyoxylate transaminase/serine-pyruvate transaminase